MGFTAFTKPICVAGHPIHNLIGSGPSQPCCLKIAQASAAKEMNFKAMKRKTNQGAKPEILGGG